MPTDLLRALISETSQPVCLRSTCTFSVCYRWLSNYFSNAQLGKNKNQKTCFNIVLITQKQNVRNTAAHLLTLTPCFLFCRFINISGGEKKKSIRESINIITLISIKSQCPSTSIPAHAYTQRCVTLQRHLLYLCGVRQTAVEMTRPIPFHSTHM